MCITHFIDSVHQNLFDMYNDVRKSALETFRSQAHTQTLRRAQIYMLQPTIVKCFGVQYFISDFHFKLHISVEPFYSVAPLVCDELTSTCALYSMPRHSHTYSFSRKTLF